VRIFGAGVGEPGTEVRVSNDGPRRAGAGHHLARSETKTGTGLVHRRSAATQSERDLHQPQVAFAQVSYSIRRPLIALEMTSCWSCSVPSKMSMDSRRSLKGWRATSRPHQV
jgi:hypothetical protein